MDLSKTLEALEKTLEEIGGEMIESTSIKECSKQLLLPSDITMIEEHLLKQGAIYAYFAELYRQAKANLDLALYQYEAWRLTARRIVADELEKIKSKRVTIEDINSEIQVRYVEEIEKWQQKIRDATNIVDSLKNWLEALKMKNTTLNSLAYLATQEKSTEFTLYRRKIEELMAKAGLEKVESILNSMITIKED